MKEKIISEYGRVLRKGSIKTIVDLNESLKINFNFQVHNINDLVREFEGIMPPNRISHYVIAFIKNGTGRKTIGSYSFDIHSNLGLIFPKNIIHSTNKWSLNTTGYMLTFDDSIFEEHRISTSFLQLHKLFKLSVIPYKTFDESTSRKTENLFGELKILNESKNVQDQKLLILKLAELILVYQKEFLSDEDLLTEKKTLFDSFVDLVELNYKKEKRVSYYSSKLSIHPNHLNKIVQASAKQSAKDYINNRVVQEAKYMLTATSVPVKEIAHDLGYIDFNYFSRFFKNIVTESPLDYRKKNI